MKNIRQLLVQCLQAAGGTGIALPSGGISVSVVNELLDAGGFDIFRTLFPVGFIDRVKH